MTDKVVRFFLRHAAGVYARLRHALKIIQGLPLVVAREVEHVADAAPLDYLLYVIAPIRVYYNVSLVRLAEKIVITSHHFLIRAHQKDRNVVGLAREWMQLQHVFNVFEVDELIYVPVGIAGYVYESGVIGRLLVKAMYRHYGE